MSNYKRENGDDAFGMRFSMKPEGEVSTTQKFQYTNNESYTKENVRVFAKLSTGGLSGGDNEEGQEAMFTAYEWNELAERDDTFYDQFRQVLDAAGVSAEERQ